jgi:hypothetical protein
MAVCDLSALNPNVLFELGMRQAFDKPVALIEEVGTPKIFDINPLRIARYRRERLYDEVVEDQRKITETIRTTFEAAGKSETVNSMVRLLSIKPAKLADMAELQRDPMVQLMLAEIADLRGAIDRVAGASRSTNSGWRPVPDPPYLEAFVATYGPYIKQPMRTLYAIMDRPSNPKAVSDLLVTCANERGLILESLCKRMDEEEYDLVHTRNLGRRIRFISERPMDGFVPGEHDIVAVKPNEES